jgi:hypothetical protein
MSKPRTYLSPLARLGYHQQRDYHLLLDKLMLPLPYLKYIIYNRIPFPEAVYSLSGILRSIDQGLLENMPERTYFEKLCTASGIPALNIRDASVPTSKADVRQICELLENDPGRFIASGTNLILRSPFENGALQQACRLMKSALKAKHKARMISFPEMLDQIKTWESCEALEKAEKAELLCLTMLGKEYTTEFTNASLKNLLGKRASCGRPTVITTHLSIGEMKERYGILLPAVDMTFVDRKLNDTIDELAKFMKENR